MRFPLSHALSVRVALTVAAALSPPDCGKECQNQDWKTHRKLCKSTGAFNGEIEELALVDRDRAACHLAFVAHYKKVEVALKFMALAALSWYAPSFVLNMSQCRDCREHIAGSHHPDDGHRTRALVLM